jgi:hypothetical protein
MIDFNGYQSKVSGYSIHVFLDDYRNWTDKIEHSLPISSEVVGYLLGRATPEFAKVHCRICKKPIVTGEQVDTSKRVGDFIPEDLHQTCYDKNKDRHDI